MRHTEAISDLRGPGRDSGTRAEARLAPPPWREDAAIGGTPPTRRLAIVSTYDELCGIAGYTRALVRHLGEHADVVVLDLDQYLLRASHRRVRALADAHVGEIAAQLRAFESVNIQLEYGTLGRSPLLVLRRLRRLASAAPSLSVTFHTVLGSGPFPWAAFSRNALRGRVFRASEIIGDFLRDRFLSFYTYRTLRCLQRRKTVHLIAHTRRDARLLRDAFRLENVHHHPLTFVTAAEAAAIREQARRDDFPQLRSLPAEAKLIGTFGFLSPYKGFETAIQALRYLPENHHLLIFGGVHPQSIQRESPLDPYVARLLRTARIGQSALDHVREAGARVNLTGEPAGLLDEHPASLHRRVHFMGALTDEQFLTAMAVCDAVVLPYLEVGQSGSGPIAMALEMGCRVLASRTLAFLQYARYHPNQIEFFDIGNFTELAELLRAASPFDVRERRLSPNIETNLRLYLQANPALGGGIPAQGEVVAAGAAR